MTSMRAPILAMVIAVAAVAGLMLMPVSSNLAADQYVSIEDRDYAERVQSFTTGEIATGDFAYSIIIPVFLNDVRVGDLLPGEATYRDASDMQAKLAAAKIAGDAEANFLVNEANVDEIYQADMFVTKTGYKYDAVEDAAPVKRAAAADAKETAIYGLYVTAIKEASKMVNGESVSIVILVGNGFQIEARAAAATYCIELPADAPAADIGYELAFGNNVPDADLILQLEAQQYVNVPSEFILLNEAR